MNIVKFSFDNELIGTRYYGIKSHFKTISLNNCKKKESTNEKVYDDQIYCNLRHNNMIKKSIYNSDNFTAKLPFILKEHDLTVQNCNLNKIFASQWIDERKCIMGTKCNKIIIMDTISGKYAIQNPLKSHPSSKQVSNHCGIHSISINPSRTLLATGAENVNDVSIYSLPNLDPIAVGFNAHAYWIFDLVWLSDDYVVSGSGDNKLALWKASENKSHVYEPFFASGFIHKKKKLNNFNEYCINNKKHHFNHCFKRSSSFFDQTPLVSLAESNNLLNNTFQQKSTFLLSNPFNLPSSNFNNRPRPHFRNDSFNIQNINRSHLPNNQNYEDDESDNDNMDSLNFNENDSEEDSVMTEDDDIEAHESLFINIRNSELQQNLHDDLDSLNDGLYNTSYELANESDVSSNLFNCNNLDDDLSDYEQNSPETSKRKTKITSENLKLPDNDIKYMNPSKVTKCKDSKRIRALAFNPKRNEIAAISMNSAFHFFDVNRFEQVLI
jgi:hypothetical protein